VARGVATADIDRDGDLDVLLTVNDGTPRLLRNDLADEASHWVRLQLRGAAPNLQALGAQVTLWSGGTAQRRMIRTGSSYLSQSEVNPLTFGLGPATEADSVVVRWPATDAVTRLGPLEAGETYLINEDGAS
jgi:hypothetical protein